MPNLRYVRKDTNHGLLASANRGAALEIGEFVVFLNNDTSVSRSWLDALLSTFAIFHECRVAGARLVNPDGRLQEAGGFVWADGGGRNLGRDDDPDTWANAHVRKVDYVFGAALMLRRAHFEDLGGFEALCAGLLRGHRPRVPHVRESGWRVYQSAAIVVHHESLPHGTDTGVGGKAYQKRNRTVFVDRWRDVLERDQCRPGELPFLAWDRSQLRLTVFVVDYRAPEPDHDAVSRAIWQLLRVFHLFGIRVKFWAMEPSADPRYARNLRVNGGQLSKEGRNATLAARLAEHGEWNMLSSVALWSLRRAFMTFSGIPAAAVLYGHDVNHQRLQRQYEVCGEAWLVPHIAHLREVEEALWRR